MIFLETFSNDISIQFIDIIYVVIEIWRMKKLKLKKKRKLYNIDNAMDVSSKMMTIEKKTNL